MNLPPEQIARIDRVAAAMFDRVAERYVILAEEEGIDVTAAIEAVTMKIYGVAIAFESGRKKALEEAFAEPAEPPRPRLVRPWEAVGTLDS